MKKLIGALVALTFVLPGTVLAQQSNADLAAQAQALLQQVAALQAQLAAQQGGAANANSLNPNPTGAINVSAVAANPASCPQIGRILKRGSTGEDVTRLQQFLALDPSVYPEGTVSGYFGPLTEKAVQKWQAKYNIVSSGSPATTGWGQVGPRTAAAIALLCATGASSPVGGYIQVSPISGNAPLNVTVIATVNSTNSCQGAIYQLNWGDNSNPVSIPVSANACTQMSQSYQHTYTTGGTYQITLSAGAHQTGATITVFGSAAAPSPAPSPTPPTPSLPPETFIGSPVTGNAPLTVTFSGVVTSNDQGWCSTGCSSILTFGDGQQGAVPLPTTKPGQQNYSVQHTYTQNGTYTATLYQGAAGSGRPTVGNITITVGGGGASTLNPPSVTPLVDSNPRRVNLTFDMTCSYNITWGDNTSDNQTPAGNCTSGVSSKTVTHTYASPGNYTITLTRGSQSNTAGVNISS